MVYRIFAGLYLFLVGLESVAHAGIPPIIVGVLALVGGLALLAGF